MRKKVKNSKYFHLNYKIIELAQCSLTSWYSPIGVKYFKINNCCVSNVNGCTGIVPTIRGSNSAHEELLASIYMVETGRWG